MDIPCAVCGTNNKDQARFCKLCGITLKNAGSHKPVKELANEGDPIGEFWVAVLCFQEGNTIEGFKWFLKSATHGHRDAQYQIGIFYLKGKHVEQDYRLAFRWFKESAERGNANAQYELGCLFAQGIGAPQNTEESFNWWFKAMLNGNPEGANEVGLCLEMGKGARKDLETAFKCFDASADTGYAPAEFNLARCFEYGIGVNKNIFSAYIWYILSAAQGLEGAIKKRDELSLLLTNDDIDKAQAAAKSIWEMTHSENSE